MVNEAAASDKAASEAAAEVEKFISYMDVEYCRYCGQSGIYLGGLNGNGATPDAKKTGGRRSSAVSNASNSTLPLLTAPCSCLRRHYRFAHMPCLIKWIQTNLTVRCPECQETYNCVHRITPLREWSTNPSTDKMMGQYCSAIVVAVLLAVLDVFVIYMIWQTVLPIPLKICVMMTLSVMYIAGLVAACSRLVILYHKMYIFNCPVVDVIPPNIEKVKTDNLLIWIYWHWALNLECTAWHVTWYLIVFTACNWVQSTQIIKLASSQWTNW